MQFLSVICRRDSMALGMRIAYRLPYACQHGQLIKDVFTAKNPASFTMKIWFTKEISRIKTVKRFGKVTFRALPLHHSEFRLSL